MPTDTTPIAPEEVTVYQVLKSIAKPMAEKDISEKVKVYSGNRDQKKVSEVIDIVLNLDTLSDIAELTKLI